ncbi:sulfite exporter TauE/SafE family protein [Nitrogeniibacter mangrovi]|uniref:Probable membrane transporter protein n=1 Tax=Nitrogeniibacter mangrovi TaxID=2016596 RepID=A0A6C1B735_9RHOO|nr:sulfite exporter TauE/SafE family protein [Nitrogeniibacter mangrovi]QID19173.1 sulfite exporter TauE/SafE family protein [Nitrogeniibacter mangrovi]
MNFDVWWLAYPLLGAFVGFFAGLLGVGGGGIMVPSLTTLFIAQGFPDDKVVHLALGTSMASIVLTSISSMRAHHAHGAVRWDAVKLMTPAILVGTYGATFIAAHIDSKSLAIFFACFMAYVSVQMLLNIKPKAHRELPGSTGMSLAGLIIGGISALVAIGGGSLTVPFLTWCNVRVQHAIGTSAAVGLPIAIAGTIGYLSNGWGEAGMPPYTAGYIYLPAFVLMLVSVATAPLGAKLAHRLPVGVLKKVFAGVLVLLCIKMLHSVLR